MQSPGRGTLLLAVLTLLLAAAAAGQTPSHPLSQISPSDTGLNLSDNTNAAPHNLSGTNWVVPAGSSLHVAGDLDLQGNSLQDYFGTACSGGEAVADVNNDGTFSCVSISGTSASVYVNESGDVMTGDLNMSRNVVRNIGSNRTNFTASGRLDMGEIIDMNSNRIRNVQDPTSSQDAVTQGYAGTEYLTRTASDSMQGDLDMLGHSIVNVDSLGNGTARTIAIDADGNVYIGNGVLSLSQALADGNVSDTITIASGGSVDTGALSGTVTNQVRTGFLSTDTALSTGNITDAYVLNTGDTMTGDLDMEGNRVHDIGGGSTNITTSGRLDVGGLIDVTDHRVRNIANATASQDAVPLSQLQGDYVARSGDSMTGNLDMVDNNITNVFHLSGYFEGSCGEGKAVKDVFDNGTVNCGDAGAGLPSTLNINNSAHKYDINMDDQNISNLPDPIASSQPTSLGFANSRYLTRQTSDSMQGDLDMLGNDITNVDRIGNGSYPVNVTSELQMSEHNITTDGGDNLTIGTDVKIYGKVWLPGGGTGGGGALAAENLSQTLEAGNSAFKYDIDMNGQNISNLPDPIGSGQPVTLGFGDSRYLNRVQPAERGRDREREHPDGVHLRRRAPRQRAADRGRDHHAAGHGEQPGPADRGGGRPGGSAGHDPPRIEHGEHLVVGRTPAQRPGHGLRRQRPVPGADGWKREQRGPPARVLGRLLPVVHRAPPAGARRAGGGQERGPQPPGVERHPVRGDRRHPAGQLPERGGAERLPEHVQRQGHQRRRRPR
ncbi:MAG: hypothetical protein SVU88_03070, partial [Candidatus Nanohaloarchaea archaeon]|nr:hypothetical protein [Candidatus Nanohaloarchaea archaeon]